MTAQWLFSGSTPSRPAREGLRARLVRHSFPHLARARAPALLTLVESLPRPVLAALPGIDLQTAEHWARHAHPCGSARLDVPAGTMPTT